MLLYNSEENFNRKRISTYVNYKNSLTLARFFPYAAVVNEYVLVETIALASAYRYKLCLL